MGKSKTGINIITFAILAYILVFFGHYQSLLLLLGFALIYEKNQWLTFQISQIFIFRILYDVFINLWGYGYQRFYDFINLFDSYKLINFISNTNKHLNNIFYFAFLVLLIIFFIKLLMKKPINIPLITNITKKLVN